MCPASFPRDRHEALFWYSWHWRPLYGFGISALIGTGLDLLRRIDSSAYQGYPVLICICVEDTRGASPSPVLYYIIHCISMTFQNRCQERGKGRDVISRCRYGAVVMAVAVAVDAGLGDR